MSHPVIVLASGGLDSCVATTMAHSENHNLAMLHVTYGQRTAAREHSSFEAIADFFNIPAERRLIVDIDYLAKIGGSALTDRSIPMPEREPHDREGIPVSYVPQRNGNLLFIAAAWADTISAHSIWTGMVEEDSSGYPDCRRTFVDAIEAAIGRGNNDENPDPKIVTPLIRMRKSEIVRAGIDVGAPLHMTWSCYQNEEEACGVCDSCLLRLRGFAEAGVPDPIPYAVDGAGEER
jgi:7-cyano-7-deazaguanine synthase